MSADDILITGTGRSGTTLTCHLLTELPGTVALFEPMRPRKVAKPEHRGNAAALVALALGEAAEMRARARETAEAHSLPGEREAFLDVLHDMDRPW